MAEMARKSMSEVQAQLGSVVEQTWELKNHSLSALARWEKGWNTFKGGDVGRANRKKRGSHYPGILAVHDWG
jgi:hypothetical protein